MHGDLAYSSYDARLSMNNLKRGFQPKGSGIQTKKCGVQKKVESKISQRRRLVNNHLIILYFPNDSQSRLACHLAVPVLHFTGLHFCPSLFLRLVNTVSHADIPLRCVAIER